MYTLLIKAFHPISIGGWLIPDHRFSIDSTAHFLFGFNLVILAIECWNCQKKKRNEKKNMKHISTTLRENVQCNIYTTMMIKSWWWWRWWWKKIKIFVHVNVQVQVGWKISKKKEWINFDCGCGWHHTKCL